MHEFIKNAFFFKKNHEIFAYFIFILYFCSRIMKGAPMRVPFSHIFSHFFYWWKVGKPIVRQLVISIMIDKKLVSELANAYLDGKPYELITCQVSADNQIVVEIDSYEGVDVDFCVELSHYLNEHLDREVEDYELEVGSVSITDPFKSLMQYRKNVGNPIEVLTADGRKLHGLLINVEDDFFEMEAEVLVQVEGKKKKQKERQTLRFSYPEVKYCKYDLKV